MEIEYVKLGRTNKETEGLQTVLKEDGYDVELTGTCDEKTVAAIRAFQKAVDVDGGVDGIGWVKSIR